VPHSLTHTQYNVTGGINFDEEAIYDVYEVEVEATQHTTHTVTVHFLIRKRERERREERGRSQKRHRQSKKAVVVANLVQHSLACCSLSSSSQT
jgi:hypothetical protein